MNWVEIAHDKAEIHEPRTPHLSETGKMAVQFHLRWTLTTLNIEL